MPDPVAVIDIGSNSIKVLVAQRESSGRLTALKMKTLDARISSGIGHAQPRLTEEAINRGIDAVRDLLSEAQPLQPKSTSLVATSAVRDAANGAEFCARVQVQTGHPVRILTGEEEANYIGRGLTSDPSLSELRDFYVFDLGGGSMECLSFSDRKIVQAVSLPLGCVRLTERFVSDPQAPVVPQEQQAIIDVTRETLMQGGFRFGLPPHAAAVGTGGTMTTARAILAARRGRSMDNSDAIMTLGELRELLAHVGRRNLEDRRRIPAMPASRADVLPTALATVIAIAEIGGLESYRNSFYNLRWGVADELLGS